MSKQANAVSILINAFRRRPQPQPAMAAKPAKVKPKDGLGDAVGEYFSFGGNEADKAVKAAEMVKTAGLAGAVAPAIGLGIPLMALYNVFKQRKSPSPGIAPRQPMPSYPTKRPWMPYLHEFADAENSPLFPYLRKKNMYGSEYYS